MELAEEHSQVLLEQLEPRSDEWNNSDRLLVLLMPESLPSVQKFYDIDGQQLIEMLDENELKALDQKLLKKLKQLLQRFNPPTNCGPKTGSAFSDIGVLAERLLEQYKPIIRKMATDVATSKGKRLRIETFLNEDMPTYEAMTGSGECSVDATAKLLQKAYDIVGHRRRHHGYFDQPMLRNVASVEMLQRHTRGLLTCTKAGFRIGKQVLHDVDI